MAPFLWPLDPTFARNCSIITEWSVVRARGPFHKFYHRVLHMEAVHLRKFWEPPNSPKCPYYIKGIFFGQFILLGKFPALIIEIFSRILKINFENF